VCIALGAFVCQCIVFCFHGRTGTFQDCIVGWCEGFPGALIIDRSIPQQCTCPNHFSPPVLFLLLRVARAENARWTFNVSCTDPLLLFVCPSMRQVRLQGKEPARLLVFVCLAFVCLFHAVVCCRLVSFAWDDPQFHAIPPVFFGSAASGGLPPGLLYLYFCLPRLSVSINRLLFSSQEFSCLLYLCSVKALLVHLTIYS
jgi:hypothetical protein